MAVAAVFMVAFAVVKADQCSSGSERLGGNKPKNVLSMLQTKLQINVLKDDSGEPRHSDPWSMDMGSEKPFSTFTRPPSMEAAEKGATERGAAVEGAVVKAAAAESMVKQATRKLPRDPGVADSSPGWGRLNPATCVEVVLIEPRLIRTIAPAAESALRSNEADLLTLAHGVSNTDYVQDLVAQSSALKAAWSSQRLRYLNLHVTDLGGDEGPIGYHGLYSHTLKSPKFWGQLACDRILIMQSDTLFCPGSSVRLSEYFGYGYVGGRDPSMNMPRRIMMNGGFSFRSRPQILACLAVDKDRPSAPEDAFFSLHCPLLEQPPAQMADRFAVDNGATFAAEVPLGVHKPWKGEFSAHTMQMCKGAIELALAHPDCQHHRWHNHTLQCGARD